MKITNTNNAEHYKWGESAEGWHLLQNDSLSVIEECVPPGEKEQRHLHNDAQQFFYILAGTATIEISQEIFEIPARSGIHVPAGEPHQLINNSDQNLRFLVISEPKSHGDRVVSIN